MGQMAKIHVDTIEEVVDLCESKIADFINEQRVTKTLGALVAQLNHGLMFGDPRQRSRARKALDKLGFVDS